MPSDIDSNPVLVALHCGGRVVFVPAFVRLDDEVGDFRLELDPGAEAQLREFAEAMRIRRARSVGRR